MVCVPSHSATLIYSSLSDSTLLLPLLPSSNSALLVTFMHFVLYLIFFSSCSFLISLEENDFHFLPASEHLFLGHLSPSFLCCSTSAQWSSICLAVSLIQWHLLDPTAPQRI